MAIKKVKISELPDATNLNSLYAFGYNIAGGNKDNVKVPMSLLRGNTAFQEWQTKNPGKTYEDWIDLLQEPAQTAADGIEELKADLNRFGNAAIVSENARVEAERQRVLVEKLRVEAEKLRNSAEALRASDEEMRKKQEDARIVEEALRKKAEGERKAKELIRQQQEEQREQETTAAILAAETATGRLNTLSDHRDEIRDGFWWRWNEETGEWYNTGEVAKGNMMFATFEIDPTTGQLTMFTDPDYTGANFELNENGKLQVII